MEAWREELCHHGVKGQRWGVRRYQNYDGSLTGNGKRRYRGSSSPSAIRTQSEMVSNPRLNRAKDEALTAIGFYFMSRTLSRISDIVPVGESVCKDILGVGAAFGSLGLKSAAVVSAAFAGYDFITA